MGLWKVICFKQQYFRDFDLKQSQFCAYIGTQWSLSHTTIAKKRKTFTHKRDLGRHAGLRYGLGTMTNDIEETEELTQKEDWTMLIILGVSRNGTKGLRRLQTTFGGFGLCSLSAKQLISRINMLMQHYHTPTNISKKLDALIRLDSLIRYLQL